MEVRRYDSKQHLSTIQGWHKARELPEIDWSLMPERGFVAYEGENPVAVINMRDAEGGLVYMDYIMSDPERKPVGPYLEAIVEEMLQHCRNSGKKHLITWTVTPSLIERARKLGAKTYQSTILQWEVR